MPLFVISWMDKPDSLQVRMGAREAHLAYAKDHGGVKLGGPYLNDAGEMIGSLIIVEAEDLEAAKAFHAADPYKQAGLMQSATITPWRVTANHF